MLRALPLLVAAVLFAACDNSDAPNEDTVPDTASVASEPAGHDEVEEIPSREAELTRDVGSKPQEVMDYLGIDRGDRVADIFAGGGYYTYLLSERVGSTGMVWAQGFSPGLAARADSGDLADATNVTLVDSLSALPEATLDAAIIIRGFHLYPDPAELLGELNRALKAGGIVGVEEVRLGQEYGHDMETHRMGERTVIEEFEKQGFDYVGASDILYNPDDPHTEFMEGQRHLADRMLLKFAKPGEPASSEPSTAARSR
ncbi:MAG TPA: methyltransferase domain-containing protein [Gemmatimonadota bacterium]|nr:methyltransferase domain-containing protein [Gemmatimonadota bacterium]